MEEFGALLIPAVLALAVLRLLVLPIRWFFKLAIHAAGGFVCLWLLNSTALFTGVAIPVNLVTVLAAGFGGIPAMALMALLTMV